LREGFAEWRIFALCLRIAHRGERFAKSSLAITVMQPAASDTSDQRVGVAAHKAAERTSAISVHRFASASFLRAMSRAAIGVTRFRAGR
jgi:hypothetical protein